MKNDPKTLPVSQSELIIKHLWDLSADGMRLTDSEGIIRAVNEAYCRLVRLRRCALEGKPFTIVYENRIRKQILQQYKRNLRNNSIPDRYEVRRKLWDNQEPWLEFANTVIYPDGPSPMLLSVIKDISQRKQAEYALQQNEERYRLLFNNANDAVFVNRLTRDGELGRFVEVNEQACEQFLYSRDELLSLQLYQIVPNHSRYKLKQIISDLKDKAHIIYEIELLTRDKRPIPVEVNAHLFKMEEHLTVLSIARDITERKRTEDQIKHTSQQLRRLASRLQHIREEERSLIAREIHDELGQMLTALKIQLSLLSGRINDKNKEVRKKFDALGGLIDQTVETVQRISAKLRPGILDELGLIPAIEWQIKDFTENTGIPCKFSQPAESIVLSGDQATAVFRIFQEALTNVARHANATRIAVYLRQEQTALILEITDNGQGITERQINDPSALGILGMRERALLFDGKLEISGVKGSGTHVKLTMPTDTSRDS